MDWTDSRYYRVATDGSFRLDRQDPSFNGELLDKGSAQVFLQQGVKHLQELQDVLYADGRHGLLVVFQATDAAGKDSTIKHVMSGVNPQGVEVTSFKHPSTKESRHHWLWRYGMRVPARGFIGIFNRSYYEEVLVVKVHDLVRYQNLPPNLVGKDFWERRYVDINAFEHHLANNGIRVVKFFLNISKEEQRKRFLKRLNERSKNWKFSEADLGEREHWDNYQKAVELMLRKTATTAAPWYCVPMNSKWFGRLVVVKILIEELKAMKLAYPTLGTAQLAALEKGRHALEG